MDVDARATLFSTVAAAMRAAFPDRAASLLVDLERRLEPGPWNLDAHAVSETERAGAGRAALERPPLSRDQLLAEVGRALRAAEPGSDFADRSLRDLEEWTRRSVVISYLAITGRFLFGRADRTEYVAWAAEALEAGYDGESVRIMAGLGGEELGDWYFAPRLAAMEAALGLHGSDEDALIQYAREISRDVVLGLITPHEALRRIGEPYAWGTTDMAPAGIRGWATLYRDMDEYIGFDEALAGTPERVLALARATLEAVK